METRELGKGGPQVPVICFGAWPVGGGMGIVPKDQAIDTVKAALDLGLTFIDTAESYLESEKYVGEAIRGRRDQVFLATKVSQEHSPAHLNWAIDNSLKNLGTDYVDLYQLHLPRTQWPIGQTMENLLRLREAGKIRYFGLSNFSAEETEEAVQFGPIHSSQPPYNLLHRDIEQDLLPVCLKHGIGVLAYSPLGKGLLTGRYRPGHRFEGGSERSRTDLTAFSGEIFERICELNEGLKIWAQDHGRDLVQLAIAWTLAHPAITSSIVGAKSPEQIRHSATAADWRLSESDLKEIDEIQGDLRLHRW